eukprot:scaffold707_cov399-Prasinococcus_capsulatus_cf.AAC.6
MEGVAKPVAFPEETFTRSVDPTLARWTTPVACPGCSVTSRHQMRHRVTRALSFRSYKTLSGWNVCGIADCIDRHWTWYCGGCRGLMR